MKAVSQTLSQENLQAEFHKKTHAFDVGLIYAAVVLIHSFILTLFATFGDGRPLKTPFLFYIIGLGIAEFIINKGFKDDIARISFHKLSANRIKIIWPMNSGTYWGFFWAALDVVLDYLIIQWALTSSLPYNLIFPLFFGSKAIGMGVQSYFCLTKSVDSQLFTSLLISLIALYWVVFMIDLKPVSQIVISTLLVKGLLGNFLTLARIKLTQNSEIQITYT